MHDQSFSKNSLERVLEKGDFRGVPTSNHAMYRAGVLSAAEASAQTKFSHPSVPLSSFSLKGKAVFYFPKLEDEMVGRKLCENIRWSKKLLTKGRSEIVSNLSLLLAEGVPYRVYRLDVSSFYESFNQAYVLGAMDNLHRLIPHSKLLLRDLFNVHSALGGKGVPRGLSISAALSNLLMHDFDSSIENFTDVYFYSRYVDDIIVLTSCREDPQLFLRELKKLLPKGLQLNPEKKEIKEVSSRVAPTKTNNPRVLLFGFSYLGYEFKVSEPIKNNQKKIERRRLFARRRCRYCREED